MPFHPSTRLICTIGHSSNDVETLKALLASGMSVSAFFCLFVALALKPAARGCDRSITSKCTPLRIERGASEGARVQQRA